MCMAQPEIPAAPIVPESVKRVSDDQRRAVQQNTAAAQAAASTTNKTQGQALPAGAGTQKKSLLGI